MTPLDALKALGEAAGAAVTIYNVIQEQKRRRPDDPEGRLVVEDWDKEALEMQRRLCRYEVKL